MNSLATVRDFIRWGASRFGEAGLVFGHGTDNALDESAALVLHAMHLGMELPGDYLDAVLSKTERQEVIHLIESRVSTRNRPPTSPMKPGSPDCPFMWTNAYWCRVRRSPN